MTILKKEKKKREREIRPITFILNTQLNGIHSRQQIADSGQQITGNHFPSTVHEATP